MGQGEVKVLAVVSHCLWIFPNAAAPFVSATDTATASAAAPVVLSHSISARKQGAILGCVWKSVQWVKWLMLKCSTSDKVTKDTVDRGLSDASHTYFKQLKLQLQKIFKQLCLKVATCIAIILLYQWNLSEEEYWERKNICDALTLHLMGINNLIDSLGSTNAKLDCVVVCNTCMMPFVGRKWDFTRTP